MAHACSSPHPAMSLWEIWDIYKMSMKLQVTKDDFSDLLDALILRAVFRCVQPVIFFNSK